MAFFDTTEEIMKKLGFSFSEYEFMPNPITTGRVIKENAKNLGYTVNSLAMKLNISDKAIGKWYQGKSLPDISILLNLSSLFNISLDSLIIPKSKFYKHMELSPRHYGVDEYNYAWYLIEKVVFAYTSLMELKYLDINFKLFFVNSVYELEDFHGFNLLKKVRDSLDGIDDILKAKDKIAEEDRNRILYLLRTRIIIKDYEYRYFYTSFIEENNIVEASKLSCFDRAIIFTLLNKINDSKYNNMVKKLKDDGTFLIDINLDDNYTSLDSLVRDLFKRLAEIDNYSSFIKKLIKIDKDGDSHD